MRVVYSGVYYRDINIAAAKTIASSCLDFLRIRIPPFNNTGGIIAYLVKNCNKNKDSAPFFAHYVQLSATILPSVSTVIVSFCSRSHPASALNVDSESSLVFSWGMTYPKYLNEFSMQFPVMPTV